MLGDISREEHVLVPISSSSMARCIRYRVVRENWYIGEEEVVVVVVVEEHNNNKLSIT